MNLLMFVVSLLLMQDVVPYSYSTLPSPCGQAGHLASRRIGTGSSATYAPYICQGDGTWFAIVSSGGTPAITVAPSPSSRTLIQGSTVTYTVTFTGAALGDIIEPTLTGLPTGVTYAVSPFTIPSTGGVGTYTVLASSAATIGTSTITFRGTSDATTGAGTATLIVDTPPNALSLISTTVTAGSSTFVIPTSWLDWRMINSADVNDDRKAGGPGLLGEPLATPNNSDRYFYNTQGSNISWSNGTTQSSGTSTKYFDTYTSSSVLPITLPDTSPHTIVIVTHRNDFTLDSQPNPVTCHMADSSSPDLVFTLGGSSATHRFTQILARTTTSGGTLVTCTLSNSSGFEPPQPQVFGLIN